MALLRRSVNETLSDDEKRTLAREFLKAAYPKGTQRARGVKGGSEGDYTLVMNNIKDLVQLRNASQPKSKLIVTASFLLDPENYHDIEKFAADAVAAGVDSVEFKMEHYDTRRLMTTEQIDQAYRMIENAMWRHRKSRTKIRMLHDRDTALEMILKGTAKFDITRCWVGILGWLSYAPNAIVYLCCQYYGPMLPQVGNLNSSSIKDVMLSPKRLSVLELDPRDHCVACAPSDFHINKIIDNMMLAQTLDKTFVQWLDAHFIKPLLVKFPNRSNDDAIIWLDDKGQPTTPPLPNPQPVRRSLRNLLFRVPNSGRVSAMAA